MIKQLSHWVVILAAALFATVAAAEPVQVQIDWDAPASYTDGAAIEQGDITQYTIYDGSGVVIADVTGSGVTQYVHNIDIPPGDEFCVSISVTAERESARSSPVCRALPNIPQPPSSILLEFVFNDGNSG